MVFMLGLPVSKGAREPRALSAQAEKTGPTRGILPLSDDVGKEGPYLTILRRIFCHSSGRGAENFAPLHIVME